MPKPYVLQMKHIKPSSSGVDRVYHSTKQKKPGELELQLTKRSLSEASRTIKNK